MFRLVSKVFYERLEDALELFVDVLGFDIIYREGSLVVVEHGDAKAYLVENAEYAARDRPELAIETDSIDAHYTRIATEHPGLLHPNLSQVTERPWGAREFALLDRTGVCIVYRQFDA